MGDSLVNDQPKWKLGRKTPEVSCLFDIFRNGLGMFVEHCQRNNHSWNCQESEVQLFGVCVIFTWRSGMLMQWKDKSIKTYLSALSGESSSLFSSITGIGIGFLGFFSADFKGFFFKLLSTDGVSEVAAEPDTPLSRMISGTALNEGWSFLRWIVGISSSPVSEESESPSASLGGSSSGVVSAEENEVKS